MRRSVWKYIFLDESEINSENVLFEAADERIRSFFITNFKKNLKYNTDLSYEIIIRIVRKGVIFFDDEVIFASEESQISTDNLLSKFWKFSQNKPNWWRRF